MTSSRIGRPDQNTFNAMLVAAVAARDVRWVSWLVDQGRFHGLTYDELRQRARVDAATWESLMFDADELDDDDA